MFWKQVSSAKLLALCSENPLRRQHPFAGHVYIYIYMCIYIHICICIYIYVYVHIPRLSTIDMLYICIDVNIILHLDEFDIGHIA